MFEEEIACGMKWLDTYYPGWLEKVDLKRLDLSCHCNCILGQTFGDYGDAFCMASRGLIGGLFIEGYANWSDWVTSHGFFILSSRRRCGYNYDVLTAEWKAAILARNQTVPSPCEKQLDAASLPLTSICLR